jgi:hypothetical protein
MTQEPGHHQFDQEEKQQSSSAQKVVLAHKLPRQTYPGILLLCELNVSVQEICGGAQP